MEIWKKVKNYERYEISSYGNMRNIVTNTIKKISMSNNGYSYVSLYNRKKFYIHRLVAEAFIENLHNKKIVNHINGIKTDNNIKNLEWVTKSENAKHSFNIGLNKPVITDNITNFTTKDIVEIYNSMGSYKKIALHFNTTLKTVYDIKQKKIWKKILNDPKEIEKFDFLIEENLKNNFKERIKDVKLPYKNIIITDFPNYTIDIYGNVYNVKKQKYLRVRQSKDGYVKIALSNNGIRKDYLLHRLVAESFISNSFKKSIVNHINGIKNDNRVENLEWVTISENAKHAYDIGLNKNKKNNI